MVALLCIEEVVIVDRLWAEKSDWEFWILERTSERKAEKGKKENLPACLAILLGILGIKTTHLLRKCPLHVYPRKTGSQVTGAEGSVVGSSEFNRGMDK